VTNSWTDPDQVARYLARVDALPYRDQGLAVLVRDLDGVLPGRILDLGTGNGHVTRMLLDAYPDSSALCVDLSDDMLRAATERFAGEARVTLSQHDFDDPLDFAGPFDAIVSSLAVHHVSDDRKRTLYAEAAALLAPGGVFANLDIVASPTQALHDRWRAEMGARDDASDVLRDVESQLQWLRDAGLDDVDCIWKWRSLALMRGQRR
jgi:cyclopropane fatty-acyl-phospholipid synthase-like methyltransferase